MAGYNVTVECGGVTIAPGDIIFGDANGVIAIPASSFERLYNELDTAFTEEAATQRGLEEGEEAKDLFDRYQRF
jgi:regulator of RNase E activity RraA